MFSRGSITLFRVRGIPIRVHWTLLLVLPYVAVMFSTQFASVARLAQVPPDRVTLPPLFWGALLAVALFASVALHELAHSLVALRAGGRVREITLMLLGGVSQIERMPRKPATEALMAAAGPVTSLVLGFGLVLAHRAMPHGPADPRMGLFYLGHINIVLGVFNLLPIFPMDGGRVLRAALSHRLGALRATELAARLGRYAAIGLGILGAWAGNFLLLLIAIFLYSGAQEEARGERVRSRLADLRAADVMLSAPPMIEVDAPLSRVATMMRAAGRLEVVAVDSLGRPLGVLRAADVSALAPADRGAARVADLLGDLPAPAVTMGPDEPALAALEHLGEPGVGFILVVDPASGTLVGLIGPEEIARTMTLATLAGTEPRPRMGVTRNRTA